MNFIAIDFETANSNRSSICSMGVAVVQQGVLVGTDHFYIKPTPNYYDFYNTIIHGIDDSKTRHLPTFPQQWANLKKYFNNQTIIAHNAAFDCSVLRYTLDQAQLPYPDLDYHCTYRLAQASLPLRSHKLNDVSSHFNIRLKHHDAESDARASALIAIRLCERHGVGSLNELSAGLGFKVGKIISKTQGYKPFSKAKKSV
jgi:DNA polymerase-3 subunit epsilon